jgi:RNA polymerase sigma-70 factor (ECF subfamily)
MILDDAAWSLQELGPTTDTARFAEMALPHLDAAYNLARWLTRDPADAADVVQEAMLRALRFFGSFRGGSGKSWLLTIVRNTAIDWMRANRPAQSLTPASPDGDPLENIPAEGDDPETALIRIGDRQQLDRLIAALPTEFRECLVLREMEELSYKEIAAVTGVPIGTVMSRLSRARLLLQRALIRENAQ